MGLHHGVYILIVVLFVAGSVADCLSLDRRAVLLSSLWGPPTSWLAENSRDQSKQHTNEDEHGLAVLLLHEKRYPMDRLAADLRENFPDLSTRMWTVDSQTPAALADRIDHDDEIVGGGSRKKVAVVGHGLGGTMALWLGMRSLLAPGVDGSNPVVLPSVAVSMNGILDLRWALQQKQVTARRLSRWISSSSSIGGHHENNDELRVLLSNTSPIEMLPPLTESMRRLEFQERHRDLNPPKCRLQLVHANQQQNERMTVVPVEQSIRFTVASCTGGLEVDLHRIKDERGHQDCLDPTSCSWRVVRKILLEEAAAAEGSSYQPMSPAQFLPIQRMKTATREENDCEIIVRTRRAPQLSVENSP